MKEIKEIFYAKQKEINSRLDDFKQVWVRDDNEIFSELVFCLLTPQSKAKTCWGAVMNLKKKGLLLNGDANQIVSELGGVRFRNKKAIYIVEARDFFTANNRISIKTKIKGFNKNKDAREWLVKNVRGMGYKEASHFLRNIGFGEDFAILDRHILKNLKALEVIEEIPGSISRKKYLEIEKRMIKFSKDVNIPMSYLDLVLWYKETGEIFK